MADDLTITFAADLTQVRAALASFKAEVDGNPIRMAFPVAGGAGNASGVTPGSAGFIGPMQPGSAHGPVANVSQSVSAIQAAGSSIAMALQAVAAQIRASGGVAAGGGSSLATTTATATAAAASPGAGTGAGAARAAASGLTPGAWTQGNLNQLAQVVATQGVNTSGGESGGGAVSRFGSGLSRARGLIYGVGIHEGMSALRASSLGDARGRYAGTLQEAQDATVSVADAATSGPWGTLLGLGTDSVSWFGRKTGLYDYAGSTQIKTEAMGQRATTSAQNGLQAALLAGRMGDRSRAGGVGRYGGRNAEVENAYDSETSQIASESADVSTIQDTAIRFKRTQELNLRRQEATKKREYASSDNLKDMEEEMAGHQDDQAVAEARMTRGYAGRRAITRRLSRVTSQLDKDAIGAQLNAYDSEEGLRTYQREYGAGIDAQVAESNFKREKLVGRATGMYGAGMQQIMDAQRNGTPKEVELLKRTLGFQLAGFQRDVMEGSGASFEESPLKVDFGQKGSTGLSSVREGDDSAKLVELVTQLLQSLGETNDKLDAL